MLAGRERGKRGRGVLIPHRDDAHRLQLGVGEHGLVVGERAPHTERLREGGEARGVTRAERVQLDVGQTGECLAVLLAEPTEADDSVFDFLHGEAGVPSARMASSARLVL